MTLPGPKMYFQGDDSLDLSYFKFFREFSNEKETRAKSPKFAKNIIEEKGYDTLESIARQDSIVGNNGLNENNTKFIKNFNRFAENLSEITKRNPAILKGDIVNTYKDHANKIHIHHLKHEDNEVLVIKNFGNSFFGDFGYPNFPQGTWKEEFNSDSSDFGGSNCCNSSRNDITQQNQWLNLAPNAVIVLKKI